MAIFGGSAIQPAAAGGYTIDQSLRFDDGADCDLRRTPSSSGNRRTWTFSAWVKRGEVNPSNNFYGCIWAAGSVDGNEDTFMFSDGRFRSRFSVGDDLWTYGKFSDPSAWYHVVIVANTPSATASERLRFYFNGELQSTYGTFPSQNHQFRINSSSYQHEIGSFPRYPQGNFDGYLSEVHFIDGQALTPDYFGETDATYGHWKPIEYTGTYGTNGFYLPFSGTFYNDASGNGNNWTANNLATTDVVLDSPTNNFCTLNPLNRYADGTMSEGNLKVSDTGSGAAETSTGTISMRSGKYYFEFARTTADNGGYWGIVREDVYISGGNVGLGVGDFGYALDSSGGIYVNGSYTSSLTSSFSTNDVCMVAYDADTGKVWFGRNGVWGGSGDPASGANPAATVDSYSQYGYVPYVRIIGG